MERVAKVGGWGWVVKASIWEVLLLDEGEERRSVVREPVHESHWKGEVVLPSGEAALFRRRSRARRKG
jgi:hypothetical protein